MARARRPKIVGFSVEVVASAGASAARVFIDAIEDAKGAVARGSDDESLRALAEQCTFKTMPFPTKSTRKTRRRRSLESLAENDDPERAYSPAIVVDLGLEQSEDGHWRRRWMIYGHAAT